ncbi:MAG: S-layer glycoprotein N-glycosyltransferase AglJ [Methanocellales archaeon]|nr:S-layer glycoprotein N-glycosyltransferase AglJ [Methanocellales archaeon]MDD3420928.1 S-layer glycoprotein N-glycosyltransferase AglJ [Methanocellales archaeon]MDD4897776.1 S-layer glycoprotein N-glycosyltransferase AglJ [Methanocellales archaeon]MDD5446588.1 S-layer glycoprotein N-glycosyltransferase AglJ [Methanocellales archaeon]
MRDKVCILIPTLNEAPTIGDVVEEFSSMGFPNILVMDGHSTDGTVKIATEKGAKVVTQEGRGKGQAIQQAFDLIEEDIIVMIDGDGTYLPEEVDRLIEPIEKGTADHVIGNRFAEQKNGAFTKLNLFGNQILNKSFGLAYGTWITDILSGYRAFTKKSVKELELNRTGFEIEAEITIESVKKYLRMVEVPISYLSRHERAATKLHPLKDGLRIGITLYKLTKTHNPLLYFGLLGGVFMVSGACVGVYVVLEWFKGTTRIPMTILATLLIVMGVQMLIFGLLSDLLSLFHKEVMRGLRRK